MRRVSKRAAALVFVFQAAPVFAQVNPEKAAFFKAGITGTRLVNLEIDGGAANAGTEIASQF